MSCTYTFNNKNYSYQGLIRTIENSELYITPVVSDNALNYLKRNLNMSEKEILIVAGLIQGKSLGRFREDGSILLSNLADDSVAYHEAFHRVFRAYLEQPERDNIINEFKKRKNWKSIIQPYVKQYPNSTEDELIEEVLADEFSDYVINNGKMKIEPVIKSFFEKLIDFIKKIIGLKTSYVNELFNKIDTGFYSNYKLNKTNYKGADQVLINNNPYSSEVKNEFVQGVARLVIQQILDDHSIYDFIKNSKDAPIDAYYRNAFSILGETLYETNPELVEDLLTEYNDPNSYINTQFKLYIETLIGKFEFNIVEAGEEQDNEEEGDITKEEGSKNNDVVWKASFEIDPKTSMSKAIKLLLASFEDINKENSIGVATQVRWSQAFNKIAKHLAGVPTQDSISHLSKLNEPWVNDLIDRLGGLNPETSIDNDAFRLRNDFIKTFAKTENNFVITKIDEKGISWFDANQETGQKRVVKLWKNNLLNAIKESDTFDNWVAKLQAVLNNRKSNDLDYEELLGVIVDDDLKNQILYTINNENYYYISAMNSIGNYIIKAIAKNKFSNDNLPDYNKLFDKNNFDVEGLIEHIANTQLEYEDSVDLMLFSRDKKLYGISLNTHTSNSINTLNYVASIIDPNDSLENKLAIIEQYIPGLLNYKTIDKTANGVVVRSKWLNHILNGNKLKMVIFDGVVTNAGDNQATADINETDLYAMTLNMSLHGVNLSIKHSDRSTFYGYKLEKGNIFDYQEKNTPNKEAVIDYLTKVLQDELYNEVKRSNLESVPLFQYFEKVFKNSQLFPGFTNIKDLNPYDKNSEKIIKNTVTAELNKYFEELNKYNLIQNKLGIDQSLLEYHNNDIDLMIASSFANQMLTHLEEVNVLLVDFAFFKNADDFYKRMSTTSGTGELLSKDAVTNNKIAELNARPFTIYNPKTGESETVVYDKDSSGILQSLTVFEKKDYISKLQSEKSKLSPIDNTAISELEYNFEWNLLQDELFLKEVETKEQLSPESIANIKKLSKSYSEAYNEVNENDGQSWVNMFFYREYMIRLGSWSTAMDNLFNVELQILNAKTQEDLKNIQVELNGEIFNVFDSSLWKDGVFESVHTLKPQYAGFTQSYLDFKNKTVENHNKVNAYTVFKTSYNALWPSAILGTNLQQMHHFMLKNKIDAMHMNSANKLGGIDIKSVFNKSKDQLNKEQLNVANEGFNFYGSNGSFNDNVFEGELGNQLLEQSIVVGDLASLKDQVKIGNKEKEEIKGSTQSLKILIANLMNNGKPRFDGALELLNTYYDIINRLVQNNIDDLVMEVGFDGTAITKLETLVDLIKTAAQDRNSTINIIEAIDGFLFDPYIETLPNKTKLENIFYSIINNNVVNFNRPGNSAPLLSNTGQEAFGTREVTTIDGKTEIKTNDDFLKFYSFEYDEAGNITKVNPAEIMMPLPKSWINSVLKAAKTENIIEAVEWLNKKIESGDIDTEVTFKGLRIPNQQLSSNDIIKVKKFNLPSNNAYVVVPSEFVVKAGLDS